MLSNEESRTSAGFDVPLSDVKYRNLVVPGVVEEDNQLDELDV